MYLSRFGVKNYKCLGEIDIPLTPIHVLIGQNDCGKTSLLEAMAAFHASSEKRLAETFPGPWSGRELVRHESPDGIVELSGEWAACSSEVPRIRLPLKYRLIIEFSRETGDCVCCEEEIQIRGESRPLTWPAWSRPGAAILPRFRQTGELSNGIAPADISDLRTALKPAHKYSLSARQMAVPAAFDAARRFRLDPDGFGLATLLDDILGFDPQLYLRMRDAFSELFPAFCTVRVRTDTGLQRRYNPSGLHDSRTEAGKGIEFETPSGKIVRAQHASDGAILFLGFLALAHLPDPPKLLLIEEPENGIYPKRLAQVIQLLKQLVHRTEGVRFPQIILTTHSPYVLSFFEPEEVTLLSRPADAPDAAVRARPLRDAPNIRERLGNDFYLGELWYNLSEGELFGDGSDQGGN